MTEPSIDSPPGTCGRIARTRSRCSSYFSLSHGHGAVRDEFVYCSRQIDQTNCQLLLEDTRNMRYCCAYTPPNMRTITR